MIIKYNSVFDKHYCLETDPPVVVLQVSVKVYYPIVIFALQFCTIHSLLLFLSWEWQNNACFMWNKWYEYCLQSTMLYGEKLPTNGYPYYIHPKCAHMTHQLTPSFWKASDSKLVGELPKFWSIWLQMVGKWPKVWRHLTLNRLVSGQKLGAFDSKWFGVRPLQFLHASPVLLAP